MQYHKKDSIKKMFPFTKFVFLNIFFKFALLFLDRTQYSS